MLYSFEISNNLQSSTKPYILYFVFFRLSFIYQTVLKLIKTVQEDTTSQYNTDSAHFSQDLES